MENTIACEMIYWGRVSCVAASVDCYRLSLFEAAGPKVSAADFACYMIASDTAEKLLRGYAKTVRTGLDPKDIFNKLLRQSTAGPVARSQPRPTTTHAKHYASLCCGQRPSHSIRVVPRRGRAGPARTNEREVRDPSSRPAKIIGE